MNEVLPSKVDVVVVGSGPAGSTAAYYLARQGLEVLLLDANELPREKPCGDGIGPRTVLAVREIGLGDWLEGGSFYRTENLRVVSYSGKSIVSNPRDQFEVLHGFVIPRKVFDSRLVGHAENAGAIVACRTRAVPPRNPDAPPTKIRVLRDGEPHTVETRLVVAADGSAGSYSRAWGGAFAEAHAVAFRGYLTGLGGLRNTASIMFSDRLPKGYGWIFPLSDSSANVGVGSLGMSGHGRRLRDEYDRLLSHTTQPVDLTKGKPEGSSRGAVMRMNFGRRPVIAPGTAFLGDAAGLVSPINGEGISHAMESAMMLAESLADHWTDRAALDKGMRLFSNRMNDRYLSYFRWGRLLGKVLGDKSRLDKLISLASRDEYLADLVVGVLANTYHPSRLLKPESWALRRLLRLLLPSGE